MNGRSSAERARCTHVLSVRVLNQMNNYQERVIKEVLKDVTIRCIKCHSKMIRVEEFHYENLYDDAIVGYSCENCPLLDN
jgi:hypothetical protein